MDVKSKLEDIFKPAPEEERSARHTQHFQKDKDERLYIIKGLVQEAGKLLNMSGPEYSKPLRFWMDEAKAIIKDLEAITLQSPAIESEAIYNRSRQIGGQLRRMIYVWYKGETPEEAKPFMQSPPPQYESLKKKVEEADTYPYSAAQQAFIDREKARKAQEKARKEEFISALPYTYEDIIRLDSYRRVLSLGAKDTTSAIMKKRRVTRFSVDAYNINEDIFKPVERGELTQRKELWKVKQVRENIWYFIDRLRNSPNSLDRTFLNLVKSTLKSGTETLQQAIEKADDPTLKKLGGIEQRYYFFRDASKHYLVYPNGYLRYWTYRGERAGILKKYDPATYIQAYSDLIDHVYKTIEKRVGKIKVIKKELSPYRALAEEI